MLRDSQHITDSNNGLSAFRVVRCHTPLWSFLRVCDSSMQLVKGPRDWIKRSREMKLDQLGI